MPMPNRKIVNGEPYRYAYQGQEVDPETGKEAFQLRLWDARIGRWLTTDPAGQFHSPYLGMGNNPISQIDPDGGFSGPGDGTDPPDVDGGTLPEVVINVKGCNGCGIQSIGANTNWSTEIGNYEWGATIGQYRANYNVPSNVTNLQAWYDQNHGEGSFGTWAKGMMDQQHNENMLFKLGLFAAATVSLGEVMSPGASRLSAVRAFNIRGFGIKTNSLINNPRSIWGKSAEEISESFNKQGYKTNIYQSTKGSKKSTQISVLGHSKIGHIQVHPGGGRHVGSYYKISTNKGKFKIINPETYKGILGEKGVFINR